MKAVWYNSGQDGQRKGYALTAIDSQKRILFPPKIIYEFRLNLKYPLTYQDELGNYWQPNRKFQTDMGSVPALLQIFIPKDRYLGFLFHDSAMRERGLWHSHDGKNYEPAELTRKQKDKLLKEMCANDPVRGSSFSVNAVYLGVRIGAFFGIGLPLCCAR